MRQLKIKVGKIPVHISVDIFIPVLLFSLMGKASVFFIALIFSVLHETVHLLVAYALHYKAGKININMFGEVLHLESRNIFPEHEILIYVAGPCFNLTVSAVFLLLFSYGIIPAFPNVMLINAVLGVFNLLPFYPLDGGRIVFVYLKYFMDEETAAKLIFGFSKLFLIFNFIFGIYLIQYNPLNSLVSLLAVNIFFTLKKDESSGWYDKVTKALKEHENKNYV